MSELPAGISRAEPARPRPSAAGLVVRRGADGGWDVLQVLRARGTRFMPGHLAFPGGTLDPTDRPDEQGAFERCVSREVEEETGLSVPAARWHDAGRRVTPPLFPVRFDNRFYVAETAAGWEPPAESPSPAEVESIVFHDPRAVLADWAAGRARLPPPSLPLLRALAAADGQEVATLADALAKANDLEERSPRIEFVPDVWMVPLATATLPPASHTNVWLPGGESFAIIDHGATDEAEHARLLAVIERRCATGSRPAAVILTHGHQDHVGHAVRLATELDVPLRAHQEVLDAIGRTADVRTQPLEDGEIVDLGGLTLQALLTPGHAPGHLAFLVPERRAVVVGDLVSGISTILIDPDSGDMGAYLEALRRIEALGCRLLLPGHGPPLPAKAAAKLIEHRLERERRVLAEMSRVPTGLPAIARGSYADVAELPELPAELIERQALSHLLLLERQGRAVRDDADGRSWRLAGGGTAQTIERILRERFAPVHLEIRDDSANHAGHAGATSGGGHFKVVIVAAAFEGLSLLDRHRAVNDAVGDLFGERIHALGLRTLTPGEWRA